MPTPPPHRSGWRPSAPKNTKPPRNGPRSSRCRPSTAPSGPSAGASAPETAAHTVLVTEGAWDDADWAQLEDKARTVTRAGWWIDQRDTDSADLPELLDAATNNDRGNPLR